MPNKDNLDLPAVNKEQLPQMNVSLPSVDAEIVSDDKLVGLCDEILNDVAVQYTNVEELSNDFKNMVINEGDASASSKEALINLEKLKAELLDRKTRIAELFTKLKLSRPVKVVATQNNTMNLVEGNRRDLLKQLQEGGGK